MLFRNRPRWKFLDHLDTAEIERKYSGAELNLGWLQDMADASPEKSGARAHYECEMRKERKRIDEFKSALIERGRIV
jgi:hypothetical protein